MVNVIPGGTNGANTLTGTNDADLIYGFDTGQQVSRIDATRVASGLTQPLFAGAPPGDLNRLFIVEKTGLIKILNFSNGKVRAEPFLDVSDEILTDGESGLLGLAFDPNFAQNRFFYVNLVNENGDTEIRRYTVSASDSNKAAPSSETLIISVDQPETRNHKAGWLGFGPDGYLYIPLGDGGGGGDPNNLAQNPDSLLGKVLRLDVHGDDFPASATRNYAIPADNPFVGADGIADEIWALGLRNPFRDSFDRALGTFFIADVGQNTYEEVNIGASERISAGTHLKVPIRSTRSRWAAARSRSRSISTITASAT
jgi:glucose/arabinose dehydrogenase